MIKQYNSVMTKVNFIKERCVFNMPQYKAAEENGFQVRTFITSQVSEEIMQEVHQTWEEHKEMYLPEVIDMLNQEKGYNIEYEGTYVPNGN